MWFFKDLLDLGYFDNSNIIYVECLRFCFMGLIWEELYKVVENWNLYKIWFCNVEILFGRFDILFFFFGEVGVMDYKKDMDESDLEVVENLCGEWCYFLGCLLVFVLLVEFIMEDKNLYLL